ncbi:MAG: M81 family metallopeptidase [Planctomycetes bacterium]|nr:M81 family metallopeptidase [Planctomycetota bacterium]
MRAGLIAVLQESNTFVRSRTTLRDFEEDLLLEGEAVREAFAGSHHEVGGFLEGLAAEGIEAVPVLAARAVPWGPIAGDAFERLMDLLRRGLERAGPLDGLLVAPHGATVSERHLDADGRWLGLVREHLGSRKPMVATLDPHANLSRAMLEAADALIAYRTNPHVDQRERGLEAARLLARALRGDVRPVLAAACPPMAMSIERQLTSEPPLRAILERAEEVRGMRGVLSASVILGFPYADVAEMGSSAVVVADGDLALARRLAAELGGALWDARRELEGRLAGVEDALERAASLEGPVGLLDMGDNVGGGAPGDGTHLVRALRERRLGPAIACLWDPEAVRKAERAGPGARVPLRAGGKTDALSGEPIEGDFEVVSLHAGRFEEREARHGGFRAFDQGPTAVVRAADGLTLVLTSRRVPPFSLGQLTSSGIDPTAFRFIVLKGVHAPLAAYSPVCRAFLRVDTPGPTSADMMRLEYRHRRRPMYPFEREAAWVAWGEENFPRLGSGGRR